MENKEVVFERTYDAPPEKIWQAWTDPELLKQWWGPDNVSIPECRMDARVGGEFYIVMEAGEALGQYKGTQWPMSATITELEPNAKLAYSSKAWTKGAEQDTQIEQTAVLTLEPIEGKTKMTLKVTVLNVGPGAKMAIEGMNYGFNQQFDKLDKFLKA